MYVEHDGKVFCNRMWCWLVAEDHTVTDYVLAAES
jgi:hypothetical protein